MNILEEITSKKREQVRQRRQRLPREVLVDRLAEAPPPRGFAQAVRASTEGPKVIAEVKRASPSKGVLRPDRPWDPVAIATGYEGAGAAAISVLTDGPYFWGSDDHLVAVRESVSLPVLRKDFVVDAYQIDESRWLGADAVLLMASVLSDDELHALAERALELGLDILFEAHSEAQLCRVLAVSAPAHRTLVGINHRDLTTLRLDMTRVETLRHLVPPDHTLVAESGLSSPDDLRRLMSLGVRGFLIGGSLCAADDPGAALGVWLGK